MLLLTNSQQGSFYENFISFFAFAKDAFLGFTINDAVDILLLAAVFFFTYKILKSKKIGALVVGIVICLAFYLVALAFDLSGMHFILSGIFQIGALALVVIFQPEIRELLEKMGTGSIKGLKSIGSEGKNKLKQYETIDNICRAVHILSVERTGALIVIGRTTQLDDISNSGTSINADVNDSLIRNLFYNKAPLHDGAVVIDGDKIVSAACILPLPRRTYVDIDLGTRHRAAVGLSEVSDAIVIVVSEETGVISVAKECELARNFTSDTLRNFLIQELVREERSGKKH